MASLSIKENLPVSDPGASSSSKMKQHEVTVAIDEEDKNRPPPIPEPRLERPTSKSSVTEVDGKTYRCIYKVPESLRQKMNEDCYKPRVVSIGPYHYGNRTYEAMENIKRNVLKSMTDSSSHEALREKVRSLEAKLRNFYFEKVQLDSPTFVEMMLTDAAFIIFAINGGSNKLNIFVTQTEALDIIKHDLILLENQLPFFLLQEVLETLSRAPEASAGTAAPSNDFISIFQQNLLGAFNDIIPESTYGFDQLEVNNNEFRSWTPSGGESWVDIKTTHIVDILRRYWLMLPHGEPAAKNAVQKVIYSAKKLQMSGIKIKSGTHYTHYYKRKWAPELRLRCMEINDNSRTIYGNIIALEQCRYENEQYVSDHIILLEMLIRGDCDDLLVKKGVIRNRLSSGNTANVICNLADGIGAYSRHRFTMNDLCANANAYCDRPLGKFIRFFRSLSLGDGLLFIAVLTLIQTLCAITALVFQIIFRKS